MVRFLLRTGSNQIYELGSSSSSDTGNINVLQKWPGRRFLHTRRNAQIFAIFCPSSFAHLIANSLRSILPDCTTGLTLASDNIWVVRGFSESSHRLGARQTHRIPRDLFDKNHPCRNPLDFCDVLRHELNHVIFGQIETGASHDISSRLFIFAAGKVSLTVTQPGQQVETHIFAPITAASAIPLCVISTASSSAGATWLPLTLINSYVDRKVSNIDPKVMLPQCRK